MLEKAQLEEVLAIALKNGGEYADIFLEKKKVNALVCEEDKLEKVITGTTAGAGIRIIFGEKTSFAQTNDVTLEGLKKAADTASRGVAAKKQTKEMILDSLKKASFMVEKPPGEVSLAEKAELVKAANDKARALDERVKQVSVGYNDTEKEITFANNLGDFSEEKRTKTRLTVNVIAKDEQGVQTGYDVIGGSIGMELYHVEEIEALAISAGNRALAMLNAKPAPVGKMPVVLSGEAGGTMIHEACGHGLEADLVQKGMSAYADKKGEEVASPLVTVIDDGRIPRYYGSSVFDDEGVRTKKNTLIKKGELTGYLYDRITAKKDGVDSTGNGRRESFACRPIPRMTNTYLAKGESSPHEIVKGVERGILVKRMGGGQVNTATGDYMFEVSEGYLIENGEVKDLVKGATLTGNGPETLRLVEMVGNDLGFRDGICGKDGQSVPVTSGQPTILLQELLVGGQAMDEEPYLIRK